MSLPEVMLWKGLRGRQPGKPVFRRQHPLGPYVLDFFCPSARLCVEIDGGSHSFGDRPRADAAATPIFDR
jgi:very-short-patch-repair endonuclease